MPSSSAIHKCTFSFHWNTCKPFFLLSSGAAVATYSLLLVCFYPYPVTATELVMVLLKLFFLSNSIVLCAYVLFVMVASLFYKIFAWCVRKATAYKRTGNVIAQDSFPMLSFTTSAAS